MDCSLLGSPVHGMFQARILEWVAISSAMGLDLGIEPVSVSHIGRQILYHSATWDIPNHVLPGSQIRRQQKKEQICNTIFLLNTDAEILEQ